MAEDGLFFRGVAAVNARTHAPVVAILLQGAAAIVIALSGSYGQILSYVVSVDFILFGLTGAALFVFRRREGSGLVRGARPSLSPPACSSPPARPIVAGDGLQQSGRQRGRLADPRRRRPRLPLLAAQKARGMRAMQSDYMYWAKTRAPVPLQSRLERGAAFPPSTAGRSTSPSSSSTAPAATATRRCARRSPPNAA